MIEHLVPMTGDRPYPPRTTDFTRTFWEGLADQRFLTTACTDCGKKTFPPKPICPACLSAKVEWVKLAGEGHIYSFTIIHAAPSIFAKETPYAVGIVDTVEGLRLGARLLISPDRLRISMPVSVARMDYDDGPYFGFVETKGDGADD